MKKANRVLITGTFLSLAIGIAGGLIAGLFNAPFYFGFFFAFVLAALVTMFWLAAVLSKPDQS